MLDIQNPSEKAKEDDRLLSGEGIEMESKEVSIPIHIYLLLNIYAFCLSLVVPIFLIFIYRDFMSLIRLDSMFGLTKTDFLGISFFWIWFFAPLLLVMIYFMTIIFTVFGSKLFIRSWNKKSPPMTGLFKRSFGEHDVLDKRIKYYHYRGFIIKYPLWLAKKSPFRWMQYWVLKYLMHNKIDKSTIYLEAFPCLEFSELRKNIIFMPGSVISSHVVDSIYGNLTLEKVMVEDNVLMSCNSVMAPGATLTKEICLMPSAFAIKSWIPKKEFRYYTGTPAISIEHEYKGIFSLLKEEALEIYKEKGFLSKENCEKYLKLD